MIGQKRASPYTTRESEDVFMGLPRPAKQRRADDCL